MTNQEAIETIRCAIDEVSWDYPLNYAAAFEMAIEALNQPEIVRCKDCKHSGMYQFGIDGEESLACLDIGEDGNICFSTSVLPDGYCNLGEQKKGDAVYGVD